MPTSAVHELLEGLVRGLIAADNCVDHVFVELIADAGVECHD